ncbi:MAG: CDP-glucose 4,6-dehydratase [Pedobacter sp.]|nr:MAG: CDP-glucose 4,6-dehydratase [Pedobacter sp.]
MENLVNTFEYLSNTYSKKKVFITGHTGFKGSWMLNVLSILGAEVKGYSLAPQTDDDLYNLINGDDLCHSTIADLRDKNSLTKAITDFKPDFIFHLAAQPLVRLSYEIPSETFEINAIGTANLLDAVRLLDGKCSVVLITTDKVYHNYEWTFPYRENDRLGGYDPYSASKACCELVINCYRNSFFNPQKYTQHQKAIAVGRAGNVIGGGDWSKNRLVPDIATALMTKKEVIIRNPNAIRPWQHVLEPVVAYLLLGAKLMCDPVKYSQEYNLGPYPNEALSVEDMLKLAIKNWGGGSYLIQHDNNSPHEAGILKLDISKAINELDWRPKLDAIKSIALTMEWYQEFVSNKQDIALFTKRQIINYINV